MAESYFSHLAHQEVSPAMVKRERKRKMATPEDDSKNTKIKLESEQSSYNDFAHRMMVRNMRTVEHSSALFLILMIVIYNNYNGTCAF